MDGRSTWSGPAFRAPMNILDESVPGLPGSRWDFPRAVRLGDTIRAGVTVLEAPRSSRAGAGVATFGVDVPAGVGAAVRRGRMTVPTQARAGGAATRESADR